MEDILMHDFVTAGSNVGTDGAASTSVSQTLFQAVASSDYSTLVRLYAENAHVSIVQFLEMKRRWTTPTLLVPSPTASPTRWGKGNSPFRHHHNSTSHEYGAEEKMDEFLQQVAYIQQEHQSNSPYKSPFINDRGSNSDECYVGLLHELTQFLMEQTAPPASGAASASPAAVQPMNKKPKNSVGASAISSSTFEAERLLRDTAAILSDSRPPASFVVYGPNITNNNNDTSNNSDNNSINTPPLFDGSVANATPPPLMGPATATAIGGAMATGTVAGAGTILHLACCLDVPLCLAFILNMGADARACHTAFRRLMIHEAACNGSIKCLQLLLELGQEYDSYYNKQFEEYDNSWERQHQKQAPAVAQSPDSSMNFPFMTIPTSPHPSVSRSRNSRSTSPTLLRMIHSASPHQHSPRMLFRKSISKDQSDKDDNDVDMFEDMKKPPLRERRPLYPSLDFVTSLRLFRDLSRQVQAGTISELDAARKVLFHASLPEKSQIALAKSCAYVDMTGSRDTPYTARLNSNNASNASLWRTLQRNGYTNANTSSNHGAGGGGRSDGHGNTPLHWAAFKNETECVKLLLQYHADPNAKAYPSGWTPLHDAAYSNGHESIALLLDAGANVDSRANSGATPLCFAAQEDASESAALLLERGADLTIRCCAGQNCEQQSHNSMSRFSGYTPLHYCAHYNAKNAAKILLQHPTARAAMEISDFNDRLPIHVAVARGSSDVLRELLRAGARVETPRLCSSPSGSMMNSSNTNGSSSSTSSGSTRRLPSRRSSRSNQDIAGNISSSTHTRSGGSRRSSSSSSRRAPPSPEQQPQPAPSTPPRRPLRHRSSVASDFSQQQPITPPVSSPLLLSMIPSQPVTSSKPWNCLTQRSIDECRNLIKEVEQNWTPDRHSLFTPVDRKAVAALLLVGKRFELEKGIFVDVWPEILSFCGRGWFEKDNDRDSISDDENQEYDDSSSCLIDDILEASRSGRNNNNEGSNNRDDLSLPTFC